MSEYDFANIVELASLPAMTVWRMTITKRANQPGDLVDAEVAKLREVCTKLMQCTPNLLVEIVVREPERHQCAQCSETFEDDDPDRIIDTPDGPMPLRVARDREAAAGREG